MRHILVLTLVPVSLPIVIGYLWMRLGRPFDKSVFGQLVSDIAMPCLIFSVLAEADISADAFARIASASLACLLLLTAVGTAGLYLAGLRVRTYLPSVTWGNYGFLGMPLAFYAFGKSGLAYAAVFSAVSHAFNSPLSQIVAAGATRFGAVANIVARTPLIYAVAAGITVAALHLEVPQFVLRSTSLIGGIAIPAMLIMMGASLADIKAVSFCRAMAFSILRVVVGVAIGLVVAVGLGLPDTAKHVLILQCAMPVAVLSYTFAQRWNNEPDEIASLVAVSTWSAALTIPITLTFLIH
jgi:hypothetical protein